MSAKNVHKVMEDMSEELNSYKARKIFTPEEIQGIIKIRTKFEMKLQRAKKNLSDFVNYINSEKKLLKKRNKKMEKECINVENSDRQLETNILRIYKKAFRLFNNFDLLKGFGDFCIKSHFYEAMKEIFADQLLKNTKNIEMWIFCTKKFWEVKDIESARNTLIKGLGIVDNKNELYVEFFNLEVAYADSLARFNREMGVEISNYGDVEKGEIALSIFKEIAVECTNIEVQQCIRISKLLPELNSQLKDLIAK